MKNPLGKNSAFTIVELLITIGILIILASSVVVYLNPGERLAEGRDSKRTNELNQISAALRLVYTQGKIKGSANTVYLSLPDSSATCGSYSLPQLPSGWTYACATSTNYLNVDGTGWIPVNFNTIPGGSTLSSIPTDPRNTQDFYYAYVVDPTDSTYDVTALMESEKHMKLAAMKDNGTDSSRYEVGSKLSLWSNASGLVAYWPLNEGVGNIIYDLSGSGANLTRYSLVNWVAGKNGPGVQIDATVSTSCVNQNAGIYGNVLPSSIKNLPAGKFTLSWWNYLPINSGSSRVHLATTIPVSGCGNCSIWNTLGGVTTNASGYASSNMSYSAPSTNTWHNFVYTFDPIVGQSYMYVDGKQVANGALVAGGNYGTIQWVGIGIYTPTCVDSIPGEILNNVRLYNRLLTTTEIKANYTSEK